MSYGLLVGREDKCSVGDEYMGHSIPPHGELHQHEHGHLHEFEVLPVVLICIYVYVAGRITTTLAIIFLTIDITTVIAAALTRRILSSGRVLPSLL